MKGLTSFGRWWRWEMGVILECGIQFDLLRLCSGRRRSHYHSPLYWLASDWVAKPKKTPSSRHRPTIRAPLPGIDRNALQRNTFVPMRCVHTPEIYLLYIHSERYCKCFTSTVGGVVRVCCVCVFAAFFHIPPPFHPTTTSTKPPPTHLKPNHKPNQPIHTETNQTPGDSQMPALVPNPTNQPTPQQTDIYQKPSVELSVRNRTHKKHLTLTRTRAVSFFCTLSPV